jgi:glyoxylase-like metal-dependent hydrolase (beta-lactamase superfamily II)
MIALAAVVVSGTLAGGAVPSQDPPQEQKAVRLRTLGPGDNLYVLLGGGGNTLALFREEGSVLIDTKLPGWGRPIAEAIRSASDSPVTTIINTHAHPDHVGGNVEFPTATRIIAHVNAKAAMQRMEAFKGANARYLPTETVTDKLSLFDGRDQVELYYFGAGHTNGDLVVVFPGKRLAALGDLFPSKAAPIIDTAGGGSGVAFPQTLARAVAGIKGITRVVTGHEEGVISRRDPRATSVDISTPRTMAWSDLEEYADFNRDFLAAVREAIAAGKSAGEAAAALKLPDATRTTT